MAFCAHTHIHSAVQQVTIGIRQIIVYGQEQRAWNKDRLAVLRGVYTSAVSACSKAPLSLITLREINGASNSHTFIITSLIQSKVLIQVLILPALLR